MTAKPIFGKLNIFVMMMSITILFSFVGFSSAFPVQDVDNHTSLMFKRGLGDLFKSGSKSSSKALRESIRSGLKTDSHGGGNSFKFHNDHSHSGTTPLLSPKSPLSPPSSHPSTSSGRSQNAYFGSSRHSEKSVHSSAASSPRSSQHGSSGGGSSSSKPSSPKSSQHVSFQNQPEPQPASKLNLSKYGKKAEKFVERFDAKKYPEEVRTNWRENALKAEGMKAGVKADKAEEKLQRYHQKIETKSRGELVTKIRKNIPFTVENKAIKAQKVYDHQTKKLENIRSDAKTHYENGTLKTPSDPDNHFDKSVEDYRTAHRNVRAMNQLEKNQGSSHGTSSRSGSSHSSSRKSSAPSSPRSSKH